MPHKNHIPPGNRRGGHPPGGVPAIQREIARAAASGGQLLNPPPAAGESISIEVPLVACCGVGCKVIDGHPWAVLKFINQATQEPSAVMLPLENAAQAADGIVAIIERLEQINDEAAPPPAGDPDRETPPEDPGPVVLDG